MPGPNWFFYSISESAIFSFSISSPKKYWNFFSTPVVKGFRREFVILRDFITSFYFNKASKFLLSSFTKIRSRALLFGVPLSTDSFNYANPAYYVYFNLFSRLYNVIVIGFKWPGGALSNFKRFWGYNNYYYSYKAHWKKFRYYPNIAFSSSYNYEIYSLGFESLSCSVPLVAPIDSSIDLSVFGYPILSSPTINNVYFFSNFFFIKFFQGFVTRFVRFRTRRRSKNLRFFDRKKNSKKLAPLKRNYLQFLPRGGIEPPH
jgi:hypothetical protein